MVEHPSARADDPMNEAVATTGLLLNFTAVIAIAVYLAAWGMSDGVLATVAGVVAFVSFTASIVCFRAQADEREHRRVSVG